MSKNPNSNRTRPTKKTFLTKTRAIKATCGLVLLALFGIACSSGDSPQLVSLEDSPAATVAQTTQPSAGDPVVSTTVAASQTPADGSEPQQPTETVPAGVPDLPGPTTTVAPPDTANSSNGTPANPIVPTLEQVNVPNPYGNSFSATIIIASGGDQRRVPIYDSPGGTEIVLPDGGLWYRSYYGGPLVMQVVEGSQSDLWVRVNVAARELAPDRTCTQPPCYRNGVSGWVENQGFDWVTHQYLARIDLSERSVRLWNGTQLIAETLAVIGRTSRETPVGTYFLKEKLPPLNAAYGPHILSLSAYSEQLREFQGGLPNIALHGTNQPQLIGQAVSSGCIRVPNNVIMTINDMAPLGTIVEIVV